MSEPIKISLHKLCAHLMKKRIKIQGFLVFTGIVILLILRDFLFAYMRDIRISCFGVGLVLCGYFLRISARGIKSELSPDGKTLLTGGIYSITRNPMYLGTLFIGIGVVLAVLRLWMGIVFLVIYLAIYIPQIKKETAVLTQRFGETFLKYCRNTPGFFPGLKSVFRIPAIKFKLNWAKKELSSMIATLAVISGLMIWINR